MHNSRALGSRHNHARLQRSTEFLRLNAFILGSDPLLLRGERRPWSSSHLIFYRGSYDDEAGMVLGGGGGDESRENAQLNRVMRISGVLRTEGMVPGRGMCVFSVTRDLSRVGLGRVPKVRNIRVLESEVESGRDLQSF